MTRPHPAERGGGRSAPLRSARPGRRGGTAGAAGRARPRPRHFAARASGTRCRQGLSGEQPPPEPHLAPRGGSAAGRRRPPSAQVARPRASLHTGGKVSGKVSVPPYGPCWGSERVPTAARGLSARTAG